jgi:chaperonin GroES
MAKTRKKTFEYVEPIGARVLVRKDEPKRETKGGIALPDQAEIPTITGRIVTISTQIENDDDVPLRQYDKILFHPKNAIPVDFEPDNQLFVVPVEDVVAVFRRETPDEDESSALRSCPGIVVGTLRVPQLFARTCNSGGRHRDCACYFEFENTH